ISVWSDTSGTVFVQGFPKPGVFPLCGNANTFGTLDLTTGVVTPLQCAPCCGPLYVSGVSQVLGTTSTTTTVTSAPPTSTSTTTTLPPCGSASVPACNGDCPSGMVCSVVTDNGGNVCFCHDASVPPCGGTVPSCSGACPAGTACGVDALN